MSERFTTLYRLPFSLVLEHCPVAIEAGALLKDNATGKVLAQLKLLGLSNDAVKAVKVHFDTRDSIGNLVTSPEDFQYKDLNLLNGSSTGSQIPVMFPDTNTRSFSVTVMAVALENGSVWRNDNRNAMVSFPELKPLSEYLNTNDLYEQYKIETNRYASYVPTEYKEFWRCTCGKINVGEICTSCSVEKEKLKKATDITYLTNALEKRLEEERLAEEARIAKEKAEAEEKARIKKEADDIKYNNAVSVLESSKSIQELESAKKSYDSLLDIDGVKRDDSKKEEYARKITKLKKKKRRRRILLAVCIIAIIGLGLFGYYVGYPYYLRREAETAVENHDYAKAVKNYTTLGEPDNVTATLYKEANYLLEQERFDDAIKAFSDLGDYENSKEMVSASTYQKGKSLFEQKSYKEAISVFSKVEKYEDSKQFIAQANYELALIEIESKNYEEALSYLKAASGQVDGAKAKIDEVRYTYGHALMDSGKFADAAEQFGHLISNKEYTDAKDLNHECSYKAGIDALESKDYKNAIHLLNVVAKDGNYGDANSKINEAKYLYILGHKSIDDSLTYSYLTDLKKIGYADSNSIYNSLYQWKVEIYAVNSSSSSKTNKSSLSRRDKAYAHFKVSGGTPTGTIKIRIAGYLPNTSGPLYSDYIDCSRGTDSWYSVYYTDSGASGTGWFRAYDQNGNLLDSVTFSMY